MTNLELFLQRLTVVSSPDPDDARRRRNLNILLLGLAPLLVLSIVISLFTARSAEGQGSLIILAGSVIMLLGVIVIYLINHYWSGKFSASLFLLLLLLVIAFSDDPEQLSGGRSLFIFIIPIVMASLILQPSAAFIFAALGSIMISAFSISIGKLPNSPAILGYFLVAFVSWLSSRSLEQALGDLRSTNANLDKLVQERTKALTESLTREMIEAGRSEAILNSIADGVVVFDTNWKSTLANPAIVNLLETPFSGIVEHSIDDLLNSDRISAKDRGTLLAMLEKPGQIGESFKMEWGKKTLSVNAAQVYDSAGAQIGTVAVFRDFTREAEVERMKSAFVAMVSHELRTPLNAILGYAEMLKEAVYGPINEKQGGATDRIMTNTQHLLDLVSELLDQAQIEAGKLKIQAAPFAPTELLDAVHGVMDKIAADKQLTFTSEIDPQLPERMNGDSYRLRQILINLANNAVKFTGRGGVHIRLFRRDAAHWGISVRDTGDGIPNDEIPHIFETFRQVDGTTTRQYGGIGLGLSIVKQLVSLMQGEIAVESELGSGSTFTILFPLNNANK